MPRVVPKSTLGPKSTPATPGQVSPQASPSSENEIEPLDQDRARVVAAWGLLPEYIKVAVLALVTTATD